MTWIRARVTERCGRCGEAIAVGAPLREFRLPQVAGRHGVKVRCAACAGEPVPADLPTAREFFREAVALAAGMPRPVQPLGGLPLDWKARQAGDREPGSDDE